MQLPRTLFLPLRGKMILIFLSLIIMPFFLSGLLTYRNYTRNTEKSARAYTEQLTDQISMNMDNYFDNIDKLTLYPFYESKIITIMNHHAALRDGSEYIPSTESLTMRLFLSSITFNRAEIRGIFMIANDGAIFSSLDESSFVNFRSDPAWTEATTGKSREITLLPPHRPMYYTDAGDPVISVVRAVRDPYDSKPLGLIKIDLSPRVYDKLLSTSGPVRSARLIITDSSGHVFYPENAQGQPLDMPRDGRIHLDGVDYLVSSRVSDKTGLTIMAMAAEQELKRDAASLVNSWLVISVISVLAAILIAVLFSSMIVKPIQHLKKKMKRVQAGDFQARADIFRRDEIGSLAEGFNGMVGEIDRLVREVFEARLRERDAQLSALQSQINPHFLYNTLELINMIAIDNDQYEISDVVANLGKLLRYTVDKLERPVVMKDERQFIAAYLGILSMRYGDRLRTVIDIPPELDDVLVPKLIIQPLVENAIRHGLKENEGCIRITAGDSDGMLVITVEDDGPGISGDRMETLIRRLEENGGYHSGAADAFGAETHGYALRNIHQRLKILYGPDFGLDIRNREAGGACFVLRLPVTRKEKG